MNKKYFSYSVKESSFLIMIFVLFLLFPQSNFPQISRTINFNPNSIAYSSKKAEDNNQYLHIALENLLSTSEVGAPEIPVKYIKLLLPQNTKIKNIVVTSKTKINQNINFTIFPGQLPEPTSILSKPQKFISPDKKIYSSANPYPENVFRIIDQSYFDGNNLIATLAIYPIQYFPLENRIEFNNDISYSLVLESYIENSLTTPKFRDIWDQKVYNNILMAIVDNPEDIPSFQSKPQNPTNSTIFKNHLVIPPPIPYYKYVIVTTNSMKNSFNKLLDWKRRKGINIGVVTIEEILTSYTQGDMISNINDAAGSLRQYLRNGYALGGGTMYALLADSLLPNNGHSIPIRYGCGDNNTWSYYPGSNPPDDEYHIPTDLYFSSFQGNWNVDGADDIDGVFRYGEKNDDVVSAYAQIFVGRMFFSNSTEIDSWITKVIKYEQNPFNGNYNSSTKILWSQSDEMQVTGPFKPIDEARDVISSNTKFSSLPHTIMEEDPSGDDLNPIAPSGSEIINALNTGYGFWNIYNHGESYDIMVRCPGIHNTALSPTFGIFRYDADPSGNYQDEFGNGLDNITQNNTSSIVYSNACHVAQPDDPQYRSFADIYTTLHNSGGPAFLGNTRFGFVGYSLVLHKAFINCLYKTNPNSEVYNIGATEATSKMNNYADLKHYLNLSHNLYGDPEMPIWTAVPSPLSNVTVSDAGNSITVNTGTSDSKICISSLDDGASYYNIQPGPSYTFTTSIRPLVVTVTKHNYIPYMAITGGTISSNATFYNNAKVLSNLTINSGVSLTVQPGVDLTFASGVSLIVNGTLKANGTSTNNITFDRTGASGSWGGLVFNSGSSGSIEYCNIYHATNGITSSYTLPMIRHNTISNNATGIYVSNVGTPSNEISYNTIQNNTSRGINLYSASPKIYSNTISSNGEYGINTYNSSPYLYGNTIIGHSLSGLNFSYYSSAKLVPWNAYGYYWSAGHNTIKNNSGYGICASYWSNLYLGNSPYGGYNSISNNTSSELRAYYNSNVTAQINYWGTPFNAAELYAYQSTIDYMPYLENDPNQGSQNIVIQRNEPNNLSKVSASIVDFEKAHKLQLDGKFDEAIAMYDNYIIANPTDVKSANALVGIDECYKLSGKAGAATYLDNTIKTKANKNNELDAVSLELKNQYLIQDKKYEEAVNNFNELAKKFKTIKDVEKHSLFNAGYVYLTYLNDFKSATDKFGELAAKYPDDELVFESKYLLGNLDANNRQKLASPNLSQSDLPTLTEYALDQNYPNPFNPVTTITYQLPKNGSVTLIIYDMLGKEVKTLVNEQKEIGRYTVQFDASSLASGMYIYQLRANDYTSTKKMLLLK